jgi:hypothetical protein
MAALSPSIPIIPKSDTRGSQMASQTRSHDDGCQQIRPFRRDDMNNANALPPLVGIVLVWFWRAGVLCYVHM